VNGQFPGPLIEANWGDTIEVTIQNKIADPPEGTAMHWHGLKQKKTPWYDGVPSVGQCPVAPGSSFTYRFQADSYGTTWYHSHYSAQFAGGLVGPLIVHGPKHAEYDYDLGPIMLGDYHHEDYYDILKRVVSVSTNFRTFIPTSDNNLINGRNPHNCSQVTDGRKCTPDAPMSKFRFQSGKVYRLRVINAGAAALQRFSIDGHRLQVIANDFSPIEPYETDVISLGVGQRSDVLVKAIGKPTDSYWMRSTIGRNCALARNFFAKAVVLYEDAPRNATPTTSPYFLPEVNCANVSGFFDYFFIKRSAQSSSYLTRVVQDDLALTVPLYPITPDLSDVKTQVVGLTFGPNATGNNLFYVNNSTYRPNFNKPLLLLAHHQNSSYQYEPDWNVYDFGKAKRIRLVVNNLNSASHPMHIHGHNMVSLFPFRPPPFPPQPKKPGVVLSTHLHKNRHS
jgi:FtsP/CotA-like multicopper oxidase with cupredoxin domain